MSDAPVDRAYDSNNDRREPVNDRPKASTRSACDRCHSQKLRCSRRQGTPETPCERCLRLGQVCVYGESKRAGRPREKSSQFDKRSPASQIGSQSYSSPESQSQVTESSGVLSSHNFSAHGQFVLHPEQAQFRWPESAQWTSWAPNDYITSPSLDPNTSIPQILEGQHGLLHSHRRTPSSSSLLPETALSRHTSLATKIADSTMRPQGLPDASIGDPIRYENPSPQDMEDSIHQLSELQMSLYRCFRAVTFITLNQTTSHTASTVLNSSTSSSPFHPQLLQSPPSTELQSVFDTSRQFHEIINGLMGMLEGKAVDEAQSSISSTLSQSVAQVAASNSFSWSFQSEDESTPGQKVHSATVILVSSCYMRLLSIYSAIVEKLEQGYKSSVPMNIPNSMRVELFSPSSSDMEVAMLLEFVSHLFGRVGKAIAKSISTTEAANELSMGDLQRKEEELREKLGAVKTLLDESTGL